MLKHIGCKVDRAYKAIPHVLFANGCRGTCASPYLPVVEIFSDDINIGLNISDNFVTLVVDIVNVAEVTVSPHDLYYTFTSKLTQHLHELANTT